MRDFQTLKRILYQVYYILNRKQRFQMLGMFFVILIGSFFELLGVSAMLPFIQSILEPEELMKKKYIQFFCDIFNIQDPAGVILMVGIGIILIYLIKNAYLTLSAYLQAVYSNNTQKDLSVLMMRAYMKKPYSFFVNNGSGVIMRGVQGDIAGVYQVMQNGFKLLSESLVVASVAIYLMATDLILALGVLIVGLLCLVLVVFGLKKKISQMSSLFRDAQIKQFRWINQISGGIKDIFVYCRQKFFLRSYENACEDAYKALMYNAFVDALPERIIEAMCVSGIIVTVLLRFVMGVDTKSYVPRMAVFAMGAFRLLPSISRATGYINMFVYCREWVESAYENINGSEVEKFEEPKEKSSFILKDGEQKFNELVNVRDVWWKYPESADDVLKGISLTIHKGEAIGIIGESGSGKSTLADILLRLYSPQKGEILMDGENIDTIPLAWANTIGYVPQSVFLIDDTIRENVVFGSDNRNDDKVWDALEKASLDGFVSGLTDGLNTIVGERGVKFSGGQRQRIAIARALYDNPQILILDEATSALDNETEEAVMDAIDSLSGKITLIIIAHRLTTLRNCNKIYEIAEGKAIDRNIEEVVLHET